MSPYLAQAARRAALPIKVNAWFCGSDDVVTIVICDASDRQPFTFGCWYAESPDAVQASKDYFRLVASLETESAERSPSADAPADPASLSPEEAL